MIRFVNKVGIRLAIVLIIATLLRIIIINLILGTTVILVIFILLFIVFIFYKKKMKRFQYIYKIKDYDQQIKELETYKEKNGKLDCHYYNTLCIVQLWGLAFEDALSANEIMMQKTKKPTLINQLVYQNNKCLLLCYMKKYQELVELVECFQYNINKSKRDKKLNIL